MTGKSGEAFREWAEALAQWAPPEVERATGEKKSDGWADLARWFRSLRESFEAKSDPFLNFLSPWLTSSATVLDVGAGAGRLTIPIAARVKTVIAVEASPAMLEMLKEGVAAEGLGNVEVIAGRWPDVPVEEVDFAVCANVLYDVADLRPFLAKLDRVARRACFIYLTERHPSYAFRDLWKEFRGWTTPTKPSYKDAIRCLHALGIQPHVEILPTRQSLSFPDLEQAVAFAQRRLKLPDDPAVLNHLRDYLAKRSAHEDGRWMPPWGVLRGIVLCWEKS